MGDKRKKSVKTNHIHEPNPGFQSSHITLSFRPSGMRLYLRVLLKDPADEPPSETETYVRDFFTDAPGVLSVISVQPHSRGGFAVVLDRQEHDGFYDHLECSRLMFVL